jgi:hypothetical protein
MKDGAWTGLETSRTTFPYKIISLLDINRKKVHWSGNLDARKQVSNVIIAMLLVKYASLSAEGTEIFLLHTY